MTDLAQEYYKRHHAGDTGFRRYGFTMSVDGRSQWVLPRILGKRRILDIGCRDGSFTALMLRDHDVVGVDIDDEALRLARERHGFKTVLLNLNVDRLPFESGCFDAVFAGEVLEHLQFPDQVVADIHSVLAADGVFIGSVPNAFRLRNRIRFLLGNDFENDPTHLHHFSEKRLRAMLSRFRRIEFGFLRGRLRRFHPALFGGDMVWAAWK